MASAKKGSHGKRGGTGGRPVRPVIVLLLLRLALSGLAAAYGVEALYKTEGERLREAREAVQNKETLYQAEREIDRLLATHEADRKVAFSEIKAIDRAEEDVQNREKAALEYLLLTLGQLRNYVAALQEQEGRMLGYCGRSRCSNVTDRLQRAMSDLRQQEITVDGTRQRAATARAAEIENLRQRRSQAFERIEKAAADISRIRGNQRAEITMVAKRSVAWKPCSMSLSRRLWELCVVYPFAAVLFGTASLAITIFAGLLRLPSEVLEQADWIWDRFNKEGG